MAGLITELDGVCLKGFPWTEAKAAISALLGAFFSPRSLTALARFFSGQVPSSMRRLSGWRPLKARSLAT